MALWMEAWIMEDQGLTKSISMVWKYGNVDICTH
jgi:hypothetical protein